MPFLLAGGAIEGSNAALGQLHQLGFIADRAAGDHNEIIDHRRSAPRVVFQRHSPLNVSGLGVQTKESPISFFLFVQEGAGDQNALADDGHGRVDMPFRGPLLPDLDRRRLRKLIVIGRHGKIRIFFLVHFVFGQKFFPFEIQSLLHFS